MKFSEFTNKYKLWIIILASVLAVALIATVVLVCIPRDDGFDGGIQLNEEQKHALSTYTYDQLEDTKITLRADTMRVLQRNVARPTPQIMSDTYTLGEGEKAKTITFTAYPRPLTTSQDAAHSVSANDFTAQAQEAGLDADTYFKYYKYMLISQGYNAAQEMQRKSANGTLTQADIFKHPAADSQYGEVAEGDNAVVKEITMDASYRSFHATGLYLPAGEAVTVKVENLAAGERVGISINIHDSLAWNGGSNKAVLDRLGVKQTGNYFADTDALVANGQMSDMQYIQLQGQYNRQNSRIPWITAEFTFDHNGEYVIGTPFGGQMHINPKNCYSSAKFTISGAVETPHYILGVTTPEYFETYLKDAPGVYSTLDTENGQLVGPASAMRKVSSAEIDKLAVLWHSFFCVNETFTGGTYNRNNIVKFDYHVPAGLAVALGGYVYACPMYMFDRAMNYQGLLTGGQWGILHEIGHNHGAAYGTTWGFREPAEGEVRNNALICLAYLEMLDLGSYRDANGNIGAEHGFVAHGYSNLKYSLSITNKSDFKECDYFQMLSMYVNIMHSFGVRKFYSLLGTYKTSSSYIPQGVQGNARSDFAYRCALTYAMDFRDYFNEMYAANITDAMFDEEQLAYMEKLPKYHPVASYYAGEVNGVGNTGGDLRIGYGEYTFDLKSKTISDTDFEIVSVSPPKHGSLRKSGDVWIYRTSSMYYPTDEFRYTVRLSNDTEWTFTVTMRIDSSSVAIDSYQNVQTGNITQALEEIKTMDYETLHQAGTGVPSYNTASGNEMRVATFWYRAAKSGRHYFDITADDAAIMYFGNSFDDMQEILKYSKYKEGYNNGIDTYYSKQGISLDLEEGKYYAVKIYNLNTGGRGISKLGVKVDDETTVKDISASQVLHPYLNVDGGKDFTQYTFTPKYFVSQKSSMNLGSVSTPKSDWVVLEAPDHQDGNTYEVTLEQEKKDENGNVILDENGRPVTEGYYTVQGDKKNYLIDGQNGTLYHTIYSGGTIPPMPHNFVIDTGKEQNFNFFEIVTRNQNNSYIQSYCLYISSDNVNWTKVSEAETLTYTKQVAHLDFPQVTGRYWKLEVRKTSGGKFTVISELNAGMTSNTQAIVPLGGTRLFTTDGWINTDKVDDLQSGLIVTDKRREKFVMRFSGDSLSLFANIGKGYGDADVYIDGNYVGKIDLQSEKDEMRRLVFATENLADKEHTVEVITLADKYFNLAFAGISYNSMLFNAPNIYKEKALAISLTVFVLLFALILTVVLLAYFVPSVRKFLFDNKFVKNYDDNLKNKQAKDKTKQRKKSARATTSAAHDSANKSVGADKSDKRFLSDPVAHKETKPAAKEIAKSDASKQSTSKPAEKSAKAIDVPKSGAQNSAKGVQNSAKSMESNQKTASAAKSNEVKTAEAKQSTAKQTTSSKAPETKKSADNDGAKQQKDGKQTAKK
ncbi:MAG: M60 family metallopeptidase [Corallococcus sp.]|nr:M60 family metallopeptidase [Corallococcus sp.]